MTTIYAVVNMKKEIFDLNVRVVGEKQTFESDVDWNYSKSFFFKNKAIALWTANHFNNGNGLKNYVYTVKEVLIH